MGPKAIVDVMAERKKSCYCPNLKFKFPICRHSLYWPSYPMSDLRFSWGRDQDYCLLACNAMLFGSLILTFQWNLLHLPSGQKKEASGSSKMLVPIYETTDFHISEYRNVEVIWVTFIHLKKTKLNTYVNLCFKHIHCYYKNWNPI
jgi:hypothetical protein